jgi:two-component system cell cycle response regulator
MLGCRLGHGKGPAAEVLLNRPRVLIADDSPLVLRMVEKLLGEAGFEVVTARDGIEAIEKAFEMDLSVVILDVMMPRMNGYQACRLIKSEPATKGLPVVILTSRNQLADRFWGLETGADYYVTKDSDPKRVLDLVKNIVGHEQAQPRQRPAPATTSADILSRVNELLDRKLYEATIVSEIGRVARSLVSFDETFSSVMTIVSRVVDFDLAAMAFVDGDDIDVLMMQQRPLAPSAIDEAKSRILEAAARERGFPFARAQASLMEPRGGASGGEEKSLLGFASFPIATNGQLAGLLALAGRAVARTAPETEAFLAQMANQAYIVTQNSRLFERVKNLSVRDGLTELYNHRHSIELLQSEFDRVGRYEAGVSVLMIDIDHFKQVNDKLGHPAGDAVLREVARVLRDTLRTVDSVGRYGGEEFVAILPHTRYEEACQTAERLRLAIEANPFRVGEREVRVTASVGVASYPSDSVDSPNALIQAADKALYRAKETGRNKVV